VSPAHHASTTRATRPAPLTRDTLIEAVDWLTARDAGLAHIVSTHGAPPLWARPRSFATLARIILEQQVSLKSAATLYARVTTAMGGMTPAAVLTQGEPGLRALGLTRQKARYVVALAECVSNGTLHLPGLASLEDAEVAAALQRVPGIGPWTASIFQLMALRRPDVWPPGDLALHMALRQLHVLPQLPTSDQAQALAAVWSPWRAVAARILWHGYLAERR